MKYLITIILIGCIMSNAISQELQVNRPIDGFISFGTAPVVEFKENSKIILTIKENGQIMRGDIPIGDLSKEDLIIVIRELVENIRKRGN